MRSGRGHHDPEPGLWDSEWRFGRGRAWRGWRREVPEFRRPVPSRGRTPLAQVAEMGSDSSAVGRRRGVAAGAGAQPVCRGKATAHPEPRHRAGRPLHLPPGAGLAPTGGEAAGQGRRAPERGRGPPLRSRPWVRQRPKNQASREPSVACSPQGAPFGSSVTHGPAMAAGRTRSGQPAPHSQPCPPQDSGRAGGAEGQLRAPTHSRQPEAVLADPLHSLGSPACHGPRPQSQGLQPTHRCPPVRLRLARASSFGFRRPLQRAAP